ncbi:jg23047 [Pararge aegeria aegeria]|uniref:Jg23047 protein n=1 Tax=Pararge aegeria aegeria TaxID=348720 RepID=A0A8S4S5X2_9NEOP|nr:jg23047 [Pararge aegeria aegeria]
MLAIKEPVATVRFFGKIFGTRINYYVAEVDLTIEELERRIRAFELKDMPGEGEGLDEDRAQEAAEEQKELGILRVQPARRAVGLSAGRHSGANKSGQAYGAMHDWRSGC